MPEPSTTPDANAIGLDLFTVASGSEGIIIRWRTSMELNTEGYNLYRSINNTFRDATRVNTLLLPAVGSVNSASSYDWYDKGATLDATYSYWLEEVEFSGATHLYGPVSLQQRVIPAELKQRLYVPLTRF